MDRLWHLAVGLLVLVISVNSLTPIHQRSKSTRVGSPEDYRLPNNTIPLHYDIKLIPFIVEGNFTFNGEVIINVTVIQRTSTIVLHAFQIDIDNSSVAVTSGNVSYNIANKTSDTELQFYTLSFASSLEPGNYSIYVKYLGYLPTDMNGFYRSSYTTNSGETRWLATTQFEPVYARRVFPCFDEPALKARFTVSIAHWPNQTAVANAVEEFTSTADPTIENRVWTHFHTTPLMSTYLLAFVVSDFEYRSNADQSFRVWARPNAVDTTDYAVSVGEQILNDLNRFTGIYYNETFPKMDQFAIPDFSAGAMENWGLVTYRERLLLYKDGVATTRNKQNIATVIAHEFAHQWFGNLVSPLWWKFTWLNEGFATYFEYFATAGVETTWRLPEQFIVDYHQPALSTDSLESTHPMSDNVYSPSDINAIFDTISYSKGGSVIRMMSHFLGNSVFQQGLHIYLENMSYSAATPDDLWEALTIANTNLESPILHTHLDIKTIMDTWVNQKGYPVVTVTRNYTTATQEISQERFLLKGRGSSNDTTEYRWWIPLTYASQSSIAFTSTAPTDWIRPQDESIIISGFTTTQWIIFNVQQTGFYRVNYDDTNWGLISTYLQSVAYSVIHVLNRAQLIDDALNLARAGYLDYSVALPVTRYLTRETEYVPWAAAFTGLTYLNTMLANSTGYEDFRAYVLKLVTPIEQTLGYEELSTDEHVDKLLRLNVNSWACRMGSTACQEKAQELLLGYYNNPNASESTISADLKAWVYCEGLRYANASVWNFLWERYLATDFSGEQTLILSSLGCSQDENILNSYLTLSISANSSIRSQDTSSVFTAVYTSSPNNVDVAFDFLVNNYEAISEFYGGMNRIGNMLSGLASRVVSAAQLQKLRDFVTERQDVLGVAAAAAERAIEVAGENLSWLELYEDGIIEWLKEEVAETEPDPEPVPEPDSGAVHFTFSTILVTVSIALLRFM